ncbi:hypothetical protein A3C60_00840 [Candidatus Nomurabacteria bacterium RIFCSPHIGHO2_02_FULL_37_45]|uniref:Transcription elongation factor GreA n=2 Tax=Candidatus Nomuraibacteriota TaxID=1752729 RepID=A0A1F6Y5J2_9BACT|nr:MAG: hypothetical protein A3C60_00840 [Candidatus Nomurabacteria bacterium RIFCSPHIGHO2_02_FULL_37_45]OGI79423.1 MAG: hypothetical protein A3F19_00070 [Candidatus Nomurabacteria bacterium RIFCSPHIGHO2_12_FULL_37_29]OGI84442.1 MAG: hypothetical protein A3A92_00035 [Candidatus Nomurabacteria bacterium RIFCSPLOWO2_01_FULL_37_49]OGJ01643.1 MAG: hypothetical protein A3G98_01400 [Candidatus Nomurabacteria bacterium RIFCSPLOWO2_12_FULL_37_8]
MDGSADYITEEKRHSLLVELADLKGPKRKEILASLAYAKSLGDLSENAEYHQTREDQGKLEERIAKIEQILKYSQAVVRSGADVVEVGSKVIVQKQEKKEENLPDSKMSKEQKTYIIVGSEEADMAKGKISNRSPFGQALFGKKKGDNVSFKTPNGVVNYKVVSVS